MGAKYESLVRFQTWLEMGGDDDGWTATQASANITTDVNHIVGNNSIEFDKIAGNTNCIITKNIAAYHLHDYSLDGKFSVGIYFSSIADVQDVTLRVGVDASNYFSYTSSTVQVGWNYIEFNAKEYSSQTGNGADWNNIKYVALDITFSAAGDTLADMYLDHIRAYMPFDGGASSSGELGMVLVDGPTALHTGASDSPQAAWTSVGGVQTNSNGADQLILKVNYTNGTETNLHLQVLFPSTAIDTTAYDEGPWTDIGAGVQQFDGGFVYEITATDALDIPVDLRGRRFFHVRAVDGGAVGGDGTFTIYAEQYRRS